VTIGQCINRTLQHNWYLVNMLSSMLLWCCWGSLGVLVISQGIYVRYVNDLAERQAVYYYHMLK